MGMMESDRARSHAHLTARGSSPRWTGGLLGSIEVIVTFSAFAGAWYGFAGGDVPRGWLDGTPFDSYVVPSLTLGIVVGGGMLTALVALVSGRAYAPEASVAAGLLLAMWIVVQVVMIGPNGGVSFLQPLMLIVGLLVAFLGRRLQRATREGAV